MGTKNSTIVQSEREREREREVINIWRKKFSRFGRHGV